MLRTKIEFTPMNSNKMEVRKRSQREGRGENRRLRLGWHHSNSNRGCHVIPINARWYRTKHRGTQSPRGQEHVVTGLSLHRWATWGTTIGYPIQMYFSSLSRVHVARDHHIPSLLTHSLAANIIMG